MWVDFRQPQPEPMKQLIWGITGKKPKGSTSTYSNKSTITFSFEVITVNHYGAIIKCSTKSARYFTQDLSNNVTLDMNVWEWCYDDWHEDYYSTPQNSCARIITPTTNNTNNIKLLRGGSWDYIPQYCRSAFRRMNLADSDSYDSGFRVVCDAARTS